jgi:hypothetical protein
MHMQIAVGLLRLGHDVYYMEVTSVWPYDPVRKTKVNDSDYAVPYMVRVANYFGPTVGPFGGAFRTTLGRACLRKS